MKLFILLFMGTSLSSFAHTDSALHLPLELDFEESQAIYQDLKKNNKNKNRVSIAEPYVRESIAAGEKMSRWLRKINQNRSDNNQIRLTSKNNRGKGIPIHKPKIYGPSTIKEKYLELKNEMPKSLWNVFYGRTAINSSMPTSEKVFKEWALKTSKLYQSAVRWTKMKQYLPALSRRKYRDVRGYYYLKNIKNLNEVIGNYQSLSSEKKSKLREALEGICLNRLKNESQCSTIVSRAAQTKNLRKIKDKYWPYAVANWNSFFKISNPRTDIKWSKRNPKKMYVEFKNPNDNKIADWLKENIEDEFQRKKMNWSIQMNFVERPISSGVSFLEFKKGVTPHVSGGNKIVMDSNAPIEEYKVKWTIRHEYGHILRIPDCYHEFYDVSKNVMINYQLDTTDLMCSRSGDMNDRIYFELREKYLR